MIRCRKIADAAEMQVVQDTMDEDGHNVPSVSHYFIIENEGVVGAFSVAYAPVVFFWMQTGVTGITSFRAITLVRKTLREMGHHRMILPIEESSPYFEYLTGLGLTHLGKGELFIGEI
jgi:hypothetical protein